MNNKLTLVLLILFLLTPFVRADNTPHKITLVEAAKGISDSEAEEAIRSASELNPDGGYNANPLVVACFATMEYHYTGGRYTNQPIKFRMFMPEKIQPNEKYPLILWLHGQGESGNDNTRQLAHAQFTMEYLAGKNKKISL
ncbi:MAG: hypothetical protein LBJ67_00775 [Planctomycetaceae bacterium]|jgi:predicted peptidase|nr:hypothetical protein [Planctomycetaceae bacterium]